MTTIINPRRINRTIVVERDSRTLTARVIDALDAPNGMAEMLADAEAARDDAQQAVTDAQVIKDGLLDDLAVTADTLAPGAAATAVWDGNAQLLTLGIPEGQPGDVSGMVRFDAPQTLTAPQRLQARSNIGAANSATAVVNARTITAGTGLTGGGDLTADRTIAADFATEAEALAGVATDKVMSPVRTMAAIQSKALGEGQDWQDVTATRTHSTTYTNTTGRAMACSVEASGPTNRFFQVTDSTGAWVSVGVAFSQWSQSQFFVVPAGRSYRISGNITISRWVELR